MEILNGDFFSPRFSVIVKYNIVGAEIFISFFSRLSASVLTASLAGAMIYILTQRNFNGISRFLAFFSSFIMGVAGADTTLEIIRAFIPKEIQGDKAVGAFICSVLIVTLSVNVISYVENYIIKKKHDSEDKL